MSIRATYELFKDAGLRWWDNQGMRLGAAISFYTMLSLAPLVVVVMSIAALIFSRERAQAELADQMRGLGGNAGAEVIKGLLQSASNQPSTGVLATVMGVVLLLIGATGVFVELQDALNTIWGVSRKESSGVWGFLRA